VSNVPPTGVTINKTSISLTVGGTSQITATVSPTNAADKSVTWTSSDPTVATVSGNGLVTALKAGTAVITVRTNEGSYTRTCSVTVTQSGGSSQGQGGGSNPNPGSYSVTLVSGTGFTMSPSNGSISPVASGGSYSFSITFADGYDQSTLVVRVNGAVLVPVNGTYTITNITGSKSVTAEISQYAYAVTFAPGDGYVLMPAEGSSSPVNHGGEFSFILVFDDEYGDASPVVKANGRVLEPDGGVYIISSITSEVNVTVEAEDDSGSGMNIILIAVIAIAIIAIVGVSIFVFTRKP
jgi:hypothetical protein